MYLTEDLWVWWIDILSEGVLFHLGTDAYSSQRVTELGFFSATSISLTSRNCWEKFPSRSEAGHICLCLPANRTWHRDIFFYCGSLGRGKSGTSRDPSLAGPMLVTGSLNLCWSPVHLDDEDKLIKEKERKKERINKEDEWYIWKED